MRSQASLLIIWPLVAVFVLLCSWHGAHAAQKGAADHVRSAFLFADRKDWGNAREHASASGDTALKKLISWLYMMDTDSGASFTDITHFIRTNPDWPEQSKLAVRAELTLREEQPGDAPLLAWFEDNAPITGVGKVAFAEALLRAGKGGEKTAYLLRDAWRNGDFEPAQEQALLEEHGRLLSQEDHIMRVDRLLWEGKLSSAERSMGHVPSDKKRIFAARIALQNQKNITQALGALSDEMKKDAGVTYDLIRYYVLSDQEDKARARLMDLPDYLPYADKWWKLREAQVRHAIDEGRYEQAKRLLEGYEQLSGAEFAEASWLQGWLMLEFLRDASAAKRAFEKMYEHVRFPVSKSREGYWAARAAEQLGDTQSTKSWYANAAAFPTTFYGQLAAIKLSRQAPLWVPETPSVSDARKNQFLKSDLARAVALCARYDQDPLATRLLALVVDGTEDEAVIVGAGELGKQLNRPHLGVRVAKKALQQNIVLSDVGYPRPRIPADLPVEKSLALAITRQESEFDPQAKSRAGAMGMMQLLPSTAKEVAKKTAVGFNRVRLYEPEYNMMLGSHYLARLIRSYDGSYVKAIAAYNAGPGNVRKWLAEFGHPGNTPESVIDWIEKIPFYETRNYVQRVLENLQVYRHLGGHTGALQLEEDLLRGN